MLKRYSHRAAGRVRVGAVVGEVPRAARAGGSCSRRRAGPRGCPARSLEEGAPVVPVWAEEPEVGDCRDDAGDAARVGVATENVNGGRSRRDAFRKEVAVGGAANPARNPFTSARDHDVSYTTGGAAEAGPVTVYGRLQPEAVSADRPPWRAESMTWSCGGRAVTLPGLVQRVERSGSASMKATPGGTAGASSKRSGWTSSAVIESSRSRGTPIRRARPKGSIPASARFRGGVVTGRWRKVHRSRPRRGPAGGRRDGLNLFFPMPWGTAQPRSRRPALIGTCGEVVGGSSRCGHASAWPRADAVRSRSAAGAWLGVVRGTLGRNPEHTARDRTGPGQRDQEMFSSRGYRRRGARSSARGRARSSATVRRQRGGVPAEQDRAWGGKTDQDAVPVVTAEQRRWTGQFGGGEPVTAGLKGSTLSYGEVSLRGRHLFPENSLDSRNLTVIRCEPCGRARLNLSGEHEKRVSARLRTGGATYHAVFGTGDVAFHVDAAGGARRGRDDSLASANPPGVHEAPRFCGVVGFVPPRLSSSFPGARSSSRSLEDLRYEGLCSSSAWRIDQRDVEVPVILTGYGRGQVHLMS